MSSERILIVRVGAMGDVLHALPAVAALRREMPSAEVDWVVDPRWAPLLGKANGPGPLISRVHLADTRLWSRAPLSQITRRSLLELRRTVRERRYSAVVDMQGTLRSAVIASFARSVSVTGYANPRERLARLLYGRRVSRRGEHVVDQGAFLLGESVGTVLVPEKPVLPENPEEDHWVSTYLEPFGGSPVALLAPTAGWGAKQWPTLRYAGLAKALARLGWAVFVNASQPEDPVCQAVVDGSEGAATTAVMELVKLIAFTRRAALVVGGDTGPVHLAAALARPTVALFGPTDPARNGPWGPGPVAVLRHPSSVTSHKRVAEVEPGLAQIGVADVLDAVAEVVSR